MHCDLCFDCVSWVKLTQVLSCFTHRWVTFTHTVEYTLLNIEASVYLLFGVIVDATFYSIFGGFSTRLFLQSKYEEVEVSKLQVTNEKGDTLVNFKLCLANRDKDSYLEDELTDKLDITGLKFEASGELVFIFILLV